MDLLLALAVAVAGQVESFGRQGLEPGQVRNPVRSLQAPSPPGRSCSCAADSRRAHC